MYRIGRHAAISTSFDEPRLVAIFICFLCTTRLTFVMSIEASSVVDRQVGIDIGRRVTSPDVTVDETRLNLPASSFQGAEQPRNNLVENVRAKRLHFLIGALGFLFGEHEPPEGMMERVFPRVVPLRILWDFTLVSWHFEPVFAIG